MHVSRARARLSLAWAVLVAILGVAIFANASNAGAVGEGQFTLHLNKYEVVEGEAFDVTVVRSNGATLAQDVTVTLKLCATTDPPFIPGCNQALIDNVDFPTATLTMTAVFAAGTNETQKTVRFQSLNRSRIYNTFCGDGVAIPPTVAFPTPTDCTLTTAVVIHSVDFGSIGTPDWAPLLIRGRGAPIVNDIFPHSGLAGSQLQIHGANFEGININGIDVVVDHVEFRPLDGSAKVDSFVFNVNSPTHMTVTVPALPDDAAAIFDDFFATFDVVVISRLDDPPTFPACGLAGAVATVLVARWRR